jgi:inner membrane protease subunit 1
MAPTLLPGDFLLAARAGRFRLGALVVLEHPGRAGFELVKRITAGPGGHVANRTLGLGEWWVQGDSPDQSTDSRSFGPIPASAVRGVVVLRYWPPSRLGRVR